ncbi:MAG: hypothetical protein IPK57_21820 [Chitinophagaceae bacterium]|nr:hypothetical protein [Chitinophagaceae bacterium]
MKKYILIFIFGITYPVLSSAQTWPEDVTYVAIVANDSVITEGNLSSGKIISDLSWASSSSNACFTAVQFPKFQGNHVFYGITITAGSIIKIKAIPFNKDEEMSLYGYMLNEKKSDWYQISTNQLIVKLIIKRDRPVKGKLSTNEREIEFRNPTTNTFHIIIGVSAPKGVTERKYTLIIKSVS